MDGRRRHRNPLKANGGVAEDRWSRGGGVVRRWHRDLSHRKDTAVLLPRAGSPLRRELRWVLPRKLGSLWRRKFHLAFSRGDVSIKAEQSVADSRVNPTLVAFDAVICLVVSIVLGLGIHAWVSGARVGTLTVMQAASIPRQRLGLGGKLQFSITSGWGNAS